MLNKLIEYKKEYCIVIVPKFDFRNTPANCEATNNNKSICPTSDNGSRQAVITSLSFLNFFDTKKSDENEEVS